MIDLIVLFLHTGQAVSGAKQSRNIPNVSKLQAGFAPPYFPIPPIVDTAS